MRPFLGETGEHSPEAWQWTASPKPYPLTDRTEVIWTRMSILSERAFALVIEGESMADESYPGDTVIVDSEVRPRPGDFVVAKMEKDETVIFRKYRPRGADKAGKPIIELALLNDDYPTTIMNSGDAGFRNDYKSPAFLLPLVPFR